MILLDTHAFVWWASGRQELSDRARKAIEKEPGSIVLSVVSAWEIALLCKKNRLSLPLPPSKFITRALDIYSIEELPLKRQVAIDAVALPDFHNDPFDRVLIAEAMNHKCPLITKDALIATYPGIRAVW
jgi:PIN domain nuclease of toxin-antitoxin system